MALGFKIVVFLFLSAFALEVGDDVELNDFLNARSFSNFYRKTRNIKFELPAGTEGRIVEKKLFKSGNYGLKISIGNGTHRGDVAWVYYNVTSPRLELKRSAAAAVESIVPEDPSIPDENEDLPQSLDARDTAGMQESPIDDATHAVSIKPIQASQSDLETMAPTKIDVREAIKCFEALENAVDLKNQYRKDYLAIGRTRGRVTGSLLFHADKNNGDRVMWYPGLTPLPDNEVMDFYEFKAPPGSNLDPDSLHSIIPYPSPDKMFKADGKITFELVEFLLARSFKLGAYDSNLDPANQGKYSERDLKERKIHAFETCAKTESNAWVKRYAQYWIDMLKRSEKGKKAEKILPGLSSERRSERALGQSGDGSSKGSGTMPVTDDDQATEGSPEAGQPPYTSSGTASDGSAESAK